MSPAFSGVLTLVSYLILLSLILAAYRLVRGPSLPDRAVAADQVSLHVIAFVVVFALRSNQRALIDLVIVTAIVGFLSVVVIGIYLERGVKGKTTLERHDLRRKTLEIPRRGLFK
ncbi:MAG TPA: monovalent cation/H+ antiporter complex subunit F [Aggregatilineales bacterium]|nr:hypothetical protein [Anaerolineales bacterium]HRE48689.1 monovalent cation/H+ antiporter complex subunit F [Aggregatilineales bacterium]